MGKLFVRAGAWLASLLFSSSNTSSPPLSRTLRSLEGQLRCLVDGAPTYRMAQDMPERLRHSGVPVSVVASQFDELCPPHLDRWLGPDGMKSPDQVVVLRRFWPHVMMCTQLGYLSLHSHLSMWGLPATRPLLSRL